MKRSAGRAQLLVKVLPGSLDPLRLFSAFSDGGRAPHAFLLESADVHQRNAVRSLGCADPCLRISGRDGAWECAAFRAPGPCIMAAALPALSALGLELEIPGEGGPALLSGHLPPAARGLEERARLAEKGPMDLLRALHGAFTLAERAAFPPGGLFGAFSYDFVDCFEELPRDQIDPTPVPDFVFYLADHLFQVEHLHDRCVLTAVAFGENGSDEQHRAQDLLRFLEETLRRSPELAPLAPASPRDAAELSADLDDAAYAKVVEDLQEHILAGDVFQIVPSRSFSAPVAEDPLTVYRRLRRLNPSPYMFFLRMEDITLLGASPETALKVSRDAQGERRLEIRPIAGTKPRGLREGKLDADLDSRYESELKLDSKELAEHVMLVDLARNDVARVAKPASRRAEQLFSVEKYSHVQHLVSRISGVLDERFDPLHAYLATMNMGTLTGAPKVEAMRLLRRVERTRRGFYGGAVGYYLFDGEFDTAIVIRSLLMAHGRAVARAGAGVVYDSLPRREAEETARKASAPLAALGFPGGTEASGGLAGDTEPPLGPGGGTEARP